MKILHRVFLLSLTIACAVRADQTNSVTWGPKAGNLQMSVRLKGGGSEIKTNQPIELMVRIRNLSTNGSVFFTTWMGAEVFALGSSTPTLRAEGREAEDSLLKDGSFSGMFHPHMAPPNGYYEYEFSVGRLKDPKTNSVYKVLTKRMVGTNLVVTSNPLYVKVVPGEWKAPPSLEFP